MYWSKLVQFCTIIKNLTGFCASSSNPSHRTSIIYSWIHQVPIILVLWQCELSSFQGKDNILDEFLAKNQQTLWKLWYLVNRRSATLQCIVKKCKNLTFKVNFLSQKWSESWIYFILYSKISLLDHIFCIDIFLQLRSFFQL